MCRWIAYSGSPVLLQDLIVKPKRSLVDQILHSRMGATTTNGDGFGLGWYSEEDGSPHPWHEVPESSWGIVQDGSDEIHPFTPRDETG